MTNMSKIGLCSISVVPFCLCYFSGIILKLNDTFTCGNNTFIWTISIVPSCMFVLWKKLYCCGQTQLIAILMLLFKSKSLFTL